MTIPIITSDGRLHLMSSECCARWLCLIEALEVISKDAEQRGVDLEKDLSWIKPNALQKYINDRFHAMHSDLEHFYEQKYAL